MKQIGKRIDLGFHSDKTPIVGTEAQIPCGAVRLFDDGSEAWFFYGPRRSPTNWSSKWTLIIHKRQMTYSRPNRCAVLLVDLGPLNEGVRRESRYYGYGNTIKEVFISLRMDLKNHHDAITKLKKTFKI